MTDPDKGPARDSGGDTPASGSEKRTPLFPKGGKISGAPGTMGFLWMAIFLSALALLVFMHGRNAVGGTDTLIQSKFESLLKDGRILEAEVVKDIAAGKMNIQGRYLPKDEGPEQALAKASPKAAQPEKAAESAARRFTVEVTVQTSYS